MSQGQQVKQGEGSKRWLSLGQASAWLGVNASTLRHWADRGVLHCYRTPGGHRRFAREDLEALMRPSGLVTLPASWEREALSRVQRRLQEPAQEPWAEHLSDAVVQQFRVLGRRLLAVLRGALEQRRGIPPTLPQVHELGQEAAALLHKEGLSLRQALLAYFFFESTLSEALAEVYPTDSAQARSHAATELEALLREWLLATMVAYEPGLRDAGVGAGVS